MEAEPLSPWGKINERVNAKAKAAGAPEWRPHYIETGLPVQVGDVHEDGYGNVRVVAEIYPHFAYTKPACGEYHSGFSVRVNGHETAFLTHNFSIGAEWRQVKPEA
jgi:hypothetical protein